MSFKQKTISNPKKIIHAHIIQDYKVLPEHYDITKNITIYQRRILTIATTTTQQKKNKNTKKS